MCVVQQVVSARYRHIEFHRIMNLNILACQTIRIRRYTLKQLSVTRKIYTGKNRSCFLITDRKGSLKSRYILEIVRKIDADQIELEMIDGTLTKISGKSAEFKINGMSAEDYPPINQSSTESICLFQDKHRRSNESE